MANVATLLPAAHGPSRRCEPMRQPSLVFQPSQKLFTNIIWQQNLLIFLSKDASGNFTYICVDSKPRCFQQATISAFRFTDTVMDGVSWRLFSWFVVFLAFLLASVSWFLPLFRPWTFGTIILHQDKDTYAFQSSNSSMFAAGTQETATTTQTPPQKHHHTTTKTPPHHRKNTTAKTPPPKHQHQKHHHQKHHHTNTTTTTPLKHHHKNTTTKTPPQKRHHKNTTTKTPPQKHHHTNATTKTPPVLKPFTISWTVVQKSLRQIALCRITLWVIGV